VSERNKATIWSTDVEGIFDMMIQPTGSDTFIDKKGLTAAEVCDCLFAGPLVEFLEFDSKQNAVNHAAIHAEARRRGKPIVSECPCPTCKHSTSANPSCPECGVPWTNA